MTDRDLDFWGHQDWRKRVYQLKLEFKADTTRTTQWRVSTPLTYGSQKHAKPDEAKSNPKPLQTALKPDQSSQTQNG